LRVTRDDTVRCQICRFGYATLKHMSSAVKRQLKAGIPLDAQCADIDTMRDLGRDFTISGGR